MAVLGGWIEKGVVGTSKYELAGGHFAAFRAAFAPRQTAE